MTDPINTLILFLIFVFAVILGWLITVIVQTRRRINSQLDINSEKESKKLESKRVEMPKEEIKKFLEFDKIEDDMVIQDKGNRYVMVLKCQGINYDLMSEPEMLAVEEGFGNFLNTLKYPIQLYVQARSLNLEEGINAYKQRINSLREDYEKYEGAVELSKKKGDMDAQGKAAVEFELQKKRTMLEYGWDIVNYIEKMSMNKNILQRKYYVVVAYHTSELGLATNFTKEEAHDLAYSELYTRCRSIAAALAPCGVECSILKSEELAELLYVAYNKDEADVFSIKKALANGYYRLYSTAENVLQKKQKVIDEQVSKQAFEEAENALRKAIEDAKQRNNGLTDKEKMSDDAKALAMQLILDNADQYNDKVVDDALSSINSTMHEPVIDPDELEKIGEDEEEEEREAVAKKPEVEEKEFVAEEPEAEEIEIREEESVIQTKQEDSKEE